MASYGSLFKQAQNVSTFELIYIYNRDTEILYIYLYGAFSFVLLPGNVGLRKLSICLKFSFYLYSYFTFQNVFDELFNLFFFDVWGILWPSRGHHRLSCEKLRRAVFFRAPEAKCCVFSLLSAVFS